MIDGKPYDVDIVMAENGSCWPTQCNSFNAELIPWGKCKVMMSICSTFLSCGT